MSEMDYQTEHDVFVPNGDSQQDTAIILVGTAEEHGVPQRSIRAVQGGFLISPELADLLYDGPDETPGEPLAKAPKRSAKTSGNRAAKNKTL